MRSLRLCSTLWERDMVVAMPFLATFVDSYLVESLENVLEHLNQKKKSPTSKTSALGSVKIIIYDEMTVPLKNS